MTCGKCREKAITFQPYSGNYLCRRHFIEDIESKAKHVIRKNQWLRAGDHIGIDVSGDCASLALLFFLGKFFLKRKDIRLTAIIVENLGDRRGTAETAVSLAGKLGIPVIRESLLNKVDSSCGDDPIDSPMTSARTGHSDGERQIILERLGKNQGITKIATGRSLDDEAACILVNFLRGEAGKIFAGNPSDKNDWLPIITPFIALSEADIGLYAKERDLITCHFHQKDISRGFVQEVKSLLDGYSLRHPATKYSLLHLGENIKKSGSAPGRRLERCDEVNARGK